MTLFTSDIKKTYFKTIIIYICATIFAVLVNWIYSFFSHDVSSDYMTFAFLYPLILGVGVYTILFFINWYNNISYNMYNAAVATITVGSFLVGVNEIAGADSLYYNYFYLLSVVLFIASIVYPIIHLILSKITEGKKK